MKPPLHSLPPIDELGRASGAAGATIAGGGAADAEQRAKAQSMKPNGAICALHS